MIALAPGYHPDLIVLDEQMVRCNRPPPPVVAHLRAIGGRLNNKPAWDAAAAQWHRELAAWEAEHPELATEWAECNAAYKEREEELEREKWQQASGVYTFEHLKRLGAPETCVETIRSTTPQDTSALCKARDFWRSNAWCLTLLGGVGSGKTTAATWLALQYTTREPRQRVVWVRAVAESARPLYGAEAEVRKRECRVCDVLVLDDVLVSAVKKPDGTYPDNPAWRQWLEDVLDARWGNNRKTVITSNATGKEFIERMGVRLMDRISTGMRLSAGTESMR